MIGHSVPQYLVDLRLYESSPATAMTGITRVAALLS